MDFSEGKIGKGWNNLSVHIKKQINYQMKIRRSVDMGGFSGFLKNWSYSFVRISSVLGWRPQGREEKKLAYLLGRKLRI